MRQRDAEITKNRSRQVDGANFRCYSVGITTDEKMMGLFTD